MIKNLKKFLENYDNNSYMYVEYPHKNYWNNQLKRADLEDYLINAIKNNINQNFLYYIHIPHCHTQCLYCTCHVEITKDYEVVKNYFGYLLQEIELQKKIFDKVGIPLSFTNLHLGGGSPTFLREEEFDILHNNLEVFIDFKKLNEYAIEIDPRKIREDRMFYYHSKGINRVSFGVQEFDREVQKAVNRIQPDFLIDRLLKKEIRDLFPKGINFDLLCGLPHQNLHGFKKTIEKTIDYNPDRICLNYMHLSPKFNPHQLEMEKKALPDQELKKELFMLAEEKLSKNGYIRAGYDHFIKEDDYLAEEFKKSKTGWNRLGVVTGKYENILGAGVSSTCKVNGFINYQNTFENKDYKSLLSQKKLPISNYHISSEDDKIREFIIKSIRQFFKINKKDISRIFNIDFDEYFSDTLNKMKEFEKNDLLENKPDEILLSENGKIISNLIASRFDKYLG